MFDFYRNEHRVEKSFIEITITELIFAHISIMLTDYLLFILTSFAISPGKTFNRTKKKKKKENLRIFSQSIVGKKGQAYNTLSHLWYMLPSMELILQDNFVAD